LFLSRVACKLLVESDGQGTLMNILKRIKGLLFSPKEEWEVIEAENKSVVELYAQYIIFLALIPPFASFLGGYFYGFPRAAAHVGQMSFAGGALRATVQYLLSLPLLYMVAFVISSIAPHFDGKSDDTRALTLAAYSYTPAWLASAFGLVPGMRWFDILGFYGLYIFYHGLPRMMKCPKDHADVMSLIVLVLSVATGALHAWIVRLAVPWEAFAS
jgi:ABC-type amino acid transport system permease subunit